MGREGAMPEYAAYCAAKERCNNANHRDRKNYSERGVQFKFESYQQWLAELGPRPSSDHSVDRVDNDGNYEPGNVRWATRIEQANNTRANIRITKGNKTLTLSMWAAEMKVSEDVLYQRRFRGKSDEEILRPVTRH